MLPIFEVTLSPLESPSTFFFFFDGRIFISDKEFSICGDVAHF